MTPTTLRNIEQTFLELTSETTNHVPCQAGFVPPLAPSYHSATDHEQSMDSSSMSSSSWHTTPPPPSTTEDIMYETSSKKNSNNSNDSTASSKPRRNMGGRRPNKSSNLSPEEEEKRKVRRERNKLAAARCRRRREDHTNELLTEVEKLERKKQDLQQEVQELQREKDELEFLLETHRTQCKRQGRPMSPIDIKPVIANTMLSLADKIKQEPIETSFDTDGPPSPKRILLSSAVLPSPITHLPTNNNNNNNLNINNNSNNSNNNLNTNNNPLPSMTKPSRPNSLNVPLIITPSQALNSVSINTPSNGMFNFESLMDGGTGLTPINHPLIPNGGGRTPLDLITPTSDSSKLCSL